MFKRVSLVGSAELFKETTRIPDPVLAEESEPDPPQAIRVHALPRRVDEVAYYDYSLTEDQARTLIDALQKIKYPHTMRSAAKLSMEEFERLEALRQVLLDGMR